MMMNNKQQKEGIADEFGSALMLIILSLLF